MELLVVIIAPFLQRWPPRTVDIVGPKIDEERLLRSSGLVDERDRGVDIAGGNFGAKHPGDRPAEALGIAPDLPGFFVAGLLSEGQKFRPHAFEVGEGLVEAIGRDRRCIIDIALSTEMPLTEVAGRVAMIVQDAGERRGFRIEPVGDSALGIVLPVVQVGVDLPSLRILPGGEGAA